jgi:hypothetical protein
MMFWTFMAVVARRVRRKADKLGNQGFLLPTGKEECSATKLPISFG